MQILPKVTILCSHLLVPRFQSLLSRQGTPPHHPSPQSTVSIKRTKPGKARINLQSQLSLNNFTVRPTDQRWIKSIKRKHMGDFTKTAPAISWVRIGIRSYLKALIIQKTAPALLDITAGWITMIRYLASTAKRNKIAMKNFQRLKNKSFRRRKKDPFYWKMFLIIRRNFVNC